VRLVKDAEDRVKWKSRTRVADLRRSEEKAEEKKEYFTRTNITIVFIERSRIKPNKL